MAAVLGMWRYVFALLAGNAIGWVCWSALKIRVLREAVEHERDTIFERTAKRMADDLVDILGSEVSGLTELDWVEWLKPWWVKCWKVQYEEVSNIIDVERANQWPKESITTFVLVILSSVASMAPLQEDISLWGALTSASMGILGIVLTIWGLVRIRQIHSRLSAYKSTKTD